MANIVLKNGIYFDSSDEAFNYCSLKQELSTNCFQLLDFTLDPAYRSYLESRNDEILKLLDSLEF